MDYANGKIYKLTSSNTDDFYVGATTTQLCKRKDAHWRIYYNFVSGKIKANKATQCSFKILETGGHSDIVLIETFPCKSKDELHQRETYWIEQLDCVNKTSANKAVSVNPLKEEQAKQDKEQLRLRLKNYNERNKEEIEKIKAGKKEYAEKSITTEKKEAFFELMAQKRGKVKYSQDDE